MSVEHPSKEPVAAPDQVVVPIVFDGAAAQLISRLAETHNMEPKEIALGLLAVGSKVLEDMESGYQVGILLPVHGQRTYVFAASAINKTHLLPFARAEAEQKKNKQPL